MGDDVRTVLNDCLLAVACFGLHLFSVLVHEAGHAIAAQLLGFQNLCITVGPFEYHWKTGFRIRVNWRRLIDGAVNAQFRSIPTSGGTIRAFGFVLAGPAFSFILSRIAGLFAPSRGNPSELHAFLIVDATLLTVLTLIPGRVGIRTTDGYKIWSLLFSPTKRGQLLFALSLLPRIDDIKRHCSSNSPSDLLKVTDDLLRQTQDHPLLSGNKDWIEALIKTRAQAIEAAARLTRAQAITSE